MTILKLGQHFAESRLIEYPDPELFRLLQFAACLFTRQDIAGFLADAAAHFSTAGANQLRNFIAGLTERTRNHPCRAFESGRGAFDFWFRVEAQSRLPELLYDRAVVRFAKEFVDAAADDLPDVGDLLQLFHGTGGDRVEIRKMIRQRS